MTRILPCTCTHDFQDRVHGRGLRVFNPRRGGGYRCTVCGALASGEGDRRKEPTERPR